MRRVALAITILLCARVAAAEDSRREQSRAAFRRGVELVQKGSFADARDAFVKAYELFPHPSIMLNLGLVRARTGEYLEAEQNLVSFLSDDGGATQAEIQSARQALADVRTHIGTVSVRVQPKSARATLDGHPLPLAEGSLENERVAAGEHRLELSAEGYNTETVKVRVTASKPTIVETSLTPAHATISQPPPTSSTTRIIVGASLLSVGGIGVIIGIGCGARAIALANGYNDPMSDDYQKASIKSSGVTFRTASDVAIISGIVLAGVGVGFLLWPTPKAQITAGPNYIGIRGTF